MARGFFSLFKRNKPKPRLWKAGKRWYCGQYVRCGYLSTIGTWEAGTTPKEAYSKWRKTE